MARDYEHDRIIAPKKHVHHVRASGTAPAWSPMTLETYRRVYAWRRDRSAFKHIPNWTPKFETFQAFGVLEKQGDTHKLVGFPYKVAGRFENIKVLEMTVEPVLDNSKPVDERVTDYRGLTAPHPKTGVVEPIRKLSQDDDTPKNQAVLFGAEQLPIVETPVGGMYLMRIPVITEGEFDAMAFDEHGFLGLSVLNASAGKEIDPRILGDLKLYDTVWISRDWDETDGKRCADRLLRTLTEAGINARTLPQLGNCKDACEFIGRHGSKKFVETVNLAMQEKPAPPVSSTATKIEDMPDSVLDGWLGKLYQERLGWFPIAFAWPALLTVANVFTPARGHRTNLYTVLVGPSGSGKSDTCNWVLQLFGFNLEAQASSDEESEFMGMRQSFHEETLVQTKIASAEGLADFIGDRASRPRLWYMGEMGHTLSKALISGASFPFILADAFYQDNNPIVIEHQKRRPFSCRLSTLGGVVKDDKKGVDMFAFLFGSGTLGGWYERCLFGQYPDGAGWPETPFDGNVAKLPTLEVVRIDPSVYTAMHVWRKEENFPSHLIQSALRAAIICATFDGRSLLHADDLAPAYAFATYQQRIRLILRPNAGETTEGKVTNLILNYLKRHAPAGQWLSRSAILNNTGIYNYGPTVADKVIPSLVFNRTIDLREVVVGKTKRQEMRFSESFLNAEHSR